MSRRLPPRRFHHALKAGLPVRRAPQPQPPPGQSAPASWAGSADDGVEALTYSARGLPPGLSLGPAPAPGDVTVVYAAGGLPPGLVLNGE